MTDLDAAASTFTGTTSLEQQHLALALRALAAAARGQVEVVEEAMQILAARAALLATSEPQGSVPQGSVPHTAAPYPSAPCALTSRGSFLSLVDWR